MLHSCLCRTQGNALLLYDEITKFSQLIDHYKTGSLERKTLLSLYGGGEWSREFKNGSASVKSTAAQITGYIQPFYFCKMAEEEDVDAFNDRFVIVCPKEKESMFDDYVDLPEQYRNMLDSVFQKIYEAHQTPKEYKFNEQGLESFKIYHDDLVTRKCHVPDDENRRGILSKAKGQTARLAMIVHVLQQGFTAPTQGDFEWNTEIDGTTMEYAKAIMNYLIAQKFELMPPEIRLTNSSESATGLDEAQLNQFPLVRQYASKVAKVLLHKDTPRVSSTVIAQGKIQPPLPVPDPAPEKFNKFPTESAEKFLEATASYGFGTIQKKRTSEQAKAVTYFQRNNLQDLGDIQKKLLCVLSITEEQYELATVG